jgi:hypothetical protein
VKLSWIHLYWTADPWGGIPSKSQIRLLSACWKKWFTLLDFRPESICCLITVSTISMHLIYSISFSSALGGAEYIFRIFGHPWYKYDVQSTWIVWSSASLSLSVCIRRQSHCRSSSWHPTLHRWSRWRPSARIWCQIHEPQQS